MNTKKKNKNRSKVPKTPQKDEIKESDKEDCTENVSVTTSDKIESVPDIPTESCKEDSSKEAPAILNVVPKKPKRSKGKKKEEQLHITSTTGTEDHEGSFINKFSDILLSSDDVTKELTPKICTKKIIDKKQSEKEDLNIEKKKCDDNDRQEIMVDTETSNEQLNIVALNISETNPMQEKKGPKNKKKKRNRLDSEKSDATATTCTEAFQNLLHSQDQDNLITSNKKSADDLIKSDEIISSQSVKTDNNMGIIKDVDAAQECQNLKEVVEEVTSKKKNKKNKNQSKKYDDLKAVDILESANIIQTTETEVQPNTLHSNLSFEDSESLPQLKPVERKRKVKANKQSIASINKDMEQMNPSAETSSEQALPPTMSSTNVTSDYPLENVKVHIKSNEAQENIQEKEITSTIPPISKTLDKCFEKISDNASTIDSIQDAKVKAETIKEDDNVIQSKTTEIEKESTDRIKFDNTPVEEKIHESVDDLFMEVKPAKKKKKNQKKESELSKLTGDMLEAINVKDVLHSEERKTEDVKVNIGLENKESVSTTELNDANVIIPDLIQYPMSSSHHILDSNNNNNATIIEEISTPEILKLGIPVITTGPIIKGSGETPEVKSQDPLSPPVIEVDREAKKSVQEKTDIKSKMMEVSQDMEELRLSIERSLAELTAIDKSDKNFEEQFEKKTLHEDDPFVKKSIEEVTKVPLPMPSTLIETQNLEPPHSQEIMPIVPILTMPISESSDSLQDAAITVDILSPSNELTTQNESSLCHNRKDNKSKGKSKKKGKQDLSTTATSVSISTSAGDNIKDSKKSSNDSLKDESKNKNTDQKSTQEKVKQQSLHENYKNASFTDAIPLLSDSSFEPIDNFEDALTSSMDDVNKTFEMLASEVLMKEDNKKSFDNPQINVIAPVEDDDKDKGKKTKENPITLPKNLLGRPNIPVQSNKTDYKKEKNKLPNNEQAKVKIQDSVEIEKNKKLSKQSQTYNKKNLKNVNGSESFSYKTNENDEFIYKYSFRKVFLQSSCHVCKKDLKQRFPCEFCSLVFYCSQKHMEEDYPRHQSLCFAVSTISHLKDQKHIYADAKDIAGQDYRILRMQMILSCENILKRKLVPWEQEALLYPRICIESKCREWRQGMLKDCDGCGQVSYCAEQPEHLPSAHHRWCKSYELYKKLVNYQQTTGRLEPPLPSKVLERYQIPDRINDILASMFEEKIDMNDIQYAALTQLATAPLTVAYCHQLYISKMNSTCANGIPKRSCYTVHAVGAELQFEADGLSKWEVFFLHLRPDIKDLRVVLVGPDLNQSDLPLDLLGKIKLCQNCRSNGRRVLFNFQDKVTYHGYYSGDDFILPDIVCAFNPSIQRASMYNGEDPWPPTIQCVLRQKVPFIITGYTLEELQRDIARVGECGAYSILSEVKHNPFASVRPDRNFITDHEMPLLFKNYCFTIICGV